MFPAIEGILIVIQPSFTSSKQTVFKVEEEQEKKQRVDEEKFGMEKSLQGSLRLTIEMKQKMRRGKKAVKIQKEVNTRRV